MDASRPLALREGMRERAHQGRWRALFALRPRPQLRSLSAALPGFCHPIPANNNWSEVPTVESSKHIVCARGGRHTGSELMH